MYYDDPTYYDKAGSREEAINGGPRSLLAWRDLFLPSFLSRLGADHKKHAGNDGPLLFCDRDNATLVVRFEDGFEQPIFGWEELPEKKREFNARLAQIVAAYEGRKAA